jgi:O-antigen/teichoic acid export membrane protein
LLPFFVAKLITRHDFGIFTIVTSTVAVGAELGQLGQNATVQKFLPQFMVRQSERVGDLVDTILTIAVVCLLILAVLLLLMSGPIARAIYGDASLASYLRIAAVLMATAGLFNVFCGMLAGLQEFGKFSEAQLIRSSIVLVLGVAGAVTFGLMGVLAAQVVGSLAVAYFVGRFASRTLYAKFGAHLTPRFDRQFVGMITGFSVPVFLSALLVLPAYWLSMARLSRLFGVQEVAEFGIAFGIMQFVILVPTVTSMTALSFLSESHARSDDTFGSLSNLNLRVAWGTALLSAVFFAFAAPQLVHFAFGRKYADIHWLLLFMMLAGLVMAICNSVGSVIASTGKMWQALGLNALWLLAFGCLGVALIPRLASLGLALTYFGSYGCFAALTCLYARRVCRMSLRRIPALVGLSAVGFVGASYTLAHLPRLSAAIGCFVTLILAASGWKLAMTEEERRHAVGKILARNKRRERAGEPSSKERILYVCHVDWGWIKQRPQHLAESLQEFFDVTVVFNRSWRREGLPNDFSIDASHIPLFHIPLRGRSTLLARLDILAARIMLQLVVWWVRPTYVWLTWPDLFQYVPRWMKAPVIYDCMDDAQAFPHEMGRAAQLESLERALVDRAAVVFVSSECLRCILETRYGQEQKYHLLRNAFDGKLLPASQSARQHADAFKIGYCGTIASWMDQELLLRLVEARQDFEVHLVGPVDGGTVVASHKRIIWHGPVRHSDLATIMGQFDCLMMPFQVTPLIESVDPVKLYEYINFGKPIVSVFYNEISRFEPFVRFYRSHEEAGDIIFRIAAGDVDRKYDDAERVAFLENSRWAERAETAATVLRAFHEPC